MNRVMRLMFHNKSHIKFYSSTEKITCYSGPCPQESNCIKNGRCLDIIDFDEDEDDAICWKETIKRQRSNPNRDDDDDDD